MKISTIILSSILTFAPVNVLAQNVFDNVPVWGRNRGNPTYTKIYKDTYTTYAVDRKYTLLNNGNYGIVLYSMTYDLFSRIYYEFNCQTGRYQFQGEITGQLVDGSVENLKWIPPCSTETCQGLTRLNEDVRRGIKQYCPR